MARLDVRIDDTTLEAVSDARRADVDQAITDLIAEHQFAVTSSDGESPLHLGLMVRPERIVVTLRDASGERARAIVQREPIDAQLSEYTGIIREMTRLGEGPGSPKLEAMDIAKRLTHDEAGTDLVRALATLGPDHGTGRRIFTLLVTLLVDTTQLG